MKLISLGASGGIDRKGGKMDVGAFRAELERDAAASQWVANYLSEGESQH